MREIKFRAWDTIKMMMCEYDTDSGYPLQAIKETEYRKVMQYTGLYDKNGKEIYEGDIICYKTFYYGNEKNHIKEVKWERRTTDDFGEPEVFGYTFHGGFIEVIGNIYENPELLEHK